MYRLYRCIYLYFQQKKEFRLRLVAADPSTQGGCVNRMTHPNAYAWLSRNCKEDKRGTIPDEVLEDWKAGGARRNRLLASFVEKIYVPGAPHSTNLLRLDAFVKIRQATKDISTSLQGFEWKTEAEMGTGEGGLKWSESLVNRISSYLPFDLSVYTSINAHCLK